MSNENTATHDALNSLVNGEESTNEEVVTQNNESTDEELNENTETESVETDENKFTKEYVEGLRKESAKYRVEAKEAKEALEELKKTSQTELAEKIKAIEEAQTTLTRYKLATKHGISEEDMGLFLTASDEETLEKQASALASRSVKTPKPDRAQGKRTDAGPTSNASLFAEALGF